MGLLVRGVELMVSLPSNGSSLTPGDSLSIRPSDKIRDTAGGERRIMSCPTPLSEVQRIEGDVTSFLLDWSKGDSSALDRLTPIIYEDLLRLARARLKNEHRECTLQPTALVHESYLRLADQTKLQCENRAHFYAVAANLMRRVLIDHARKRRAHKRGAGIKITLKTGMDFAAGSAADSLVLDDALRRLAEFDERKSRAIELKYYGGMTTEEIGMVLGISVATVGRELRLGQAWLRRDLSRL
jgi:RNA polymerase sigma factor (TIGR02999 family)